MSDPVDRFERWRRKQPPRIANLAQRVLYELIPIFEAADFKRYRDYAGNDLSVVGANTIAIQRRSGDRWPTVEVQFHRRTRPSFNVTFAELPGVCNRWTSGSPVAIDRAQANVVEGDAYFILCKGARRNFDCSFGIPSFSLFPDRVIAREFSLAMASSRYLVEVFNTGIPANWFDAAPGYVSEFVFKVSRPYRPMTDPASKVGSA
jgi:hypothetical protein